MLRHTEQEKLFLVLLKKTKKQTTHPRSGACDRYISGALMCEPIMMRRMKLQRSKTKKRRNLRQSLHTVPPAAIREAVRSFRSKWTFQDVESYSNRLLSHFLKRYKVIFSFRGQTTSLLILHYDFKTSMCFIHQPHLGDGRLVHRVGSYLFVDVQQRVEVAGPAVQQLIWHVWLWAQHRPLQLEQPGNKSGSWVLPQPLYTR